MANPPSDRTAHTRVPIHPDIAGRWSPRAFDPSAELDDEQLTAVLEAARWAASWGGRQPVRFVVGRRGDSTFEALGGVLRRGNSYARRASALILVCADEGDDERTARYAVLDAGAAIATMSIEAVSRSLIIHPMAGFDVEASRQTFGIPEGVIPLAVVAIGRIGDYSQADEAVLERDSRPRERLPLEQVAFAGTWGDPAL